MVHMAPRRFTADWLFLTCDALILAALRKFSEYAPRFHRSLLSLDNDWCHFNMRQLKYHEQKLLRKHDFLNWKQDQGHREIKVMRRYHIQNRDDYSKYNRLVGSIHHLALRLSKLPTTDGFRQKKEDALLGKCYDMGLVDTGNKMSDLMDKVTVSAFARRRLGVVMVRLKMSETVKQVCR